MILITNFLLHILFHLSNSYIKLEIKMVEKIMTDVVTVFLGN